MAAVSLTSGPVTALHPETETMEVGAQCQGVWRVWGGAVGKRERERVACEVTVRIIAEGGNIERWDH